MTLLGILAFSIWLVVYFLFLYTLFRYIYYPKVMQYSYETKGIGASDQLLGLLSVSAYQTLATFTTSIQLILYGTLSNILKWIKYVLLSIVILTCFAIFWLEYHPEIMSGMHSIANCVVIPFVHFLPNLFLLLITFVYGIFWPILAFIGETIRFFSREIPIYLLFCSSISIIELIPRIGTLFRAFANDLSNGFNTINIPYSLYIELNYSSSGFNALTYGDFDFSQTFTELFGLVYFSGYGFGQCACSSGTIVWDSIFGWLYNSNPNMTIGGSLYIPGGGIFFLGINKKRTSLETLSIETSIPTSDRFLPISITGKLTSSVLGAAIELLQTFMRCIFGTNPPIYPYQNATYFSKKNVSLSKTPGYIDLSNLINKFSYTNNLNFYNNLTAINNNSSNSFLYYNDISLNFTQEYNVYHFPPDPSLRYFPNFKPFLDKVKLIGINLSELLDYVFYNIYYIILYVIKGFVPLSYSDIAAFPPSNGSTRFLARFVSLVLDAVEYVTNILIGFASNVLGFCDIRTARVYFDTGGASTLYYMQQMINITYLSPQRTNEWGQIITNPELNLTYNLIGNVPVDPQIEDTIIRISKLQDSINKESTKLRLLGTLELFVSDFSLLTSYISPYFGRWIYGILSAFASLISGAWNMIWRMIIHLVDTETKMFPADIPPNGYPLSDSFVPKSFSVWPSEKSIQSSDCSTNIYINQTTLRPGNFFVLLQDNYNELTGVNNKLLYGLLYSLSSISDAIGNGGSSIGSEWYLNFGLLPISLWDSIVQDLCYINVILFFESLIQRQIFIQIWKFNEFPEQLRQVGHKTRDSIMTLGVNINCTGKDNYNNTDAGFVCSLAFTTDSIFAIWISISEQLILVYTSFSNPTTTPDIPDFENSINITEYTIRNLTSTLVDIIPPLQVNSDGTTLDEIIIDPLRSFFSMFFILLTVPNYILRVIASSVKTSIINSDPPETAFLTFVTVVGSILQYFGDQIIFRVGMFLDSAAQFLDRIFFSGTPIFRPIIDALILIINVIRNSFTEFAIKLLAYTMNLIGTLIALFFDSQDPVTTRLSNFFTALGNFILFFIIQAPTFLLDFVFGLIEIIIPAPLGTFIVTVARFIINGLCQIIQFFITVVIDIINAFGAGLTPINLCCSGGCSKKRSEPFTESDGSMWDNGNVKTNEEPNADMIIKESHGTPTTKITEVTNIHGLSKLFVNHILKKSYPDPRKLNFDTSNEIFKKFNIPIKKIVQMTEGLKNAYKKISVDDTQNEEYNINYDSQTCDSHYSSQYTDKHRICLDNNNIQFDVSPKRFVNQNTTQNATNLSIDEAMTFIINMVPWNGSSGCDLFMTDFIKNNRTISNFTILEKIYVTDCISKRSVGEIIAIFPQFRWVPPDILYNPFSVFKTITESILAYKVYVQFQRDKVVPRSVFLSESYKSVWSNWGLNTTYMSLDNYENMLINYTLIDYMKMNNANPDFVDSIYDILNMTISNAGDVQSAMYNMSVDYQLSSIKYLDTVVENYIISQNSTNTDSSVQVNTMKMWSFFLSSLSSTYNLMKRTYLSVNRRSETNEFKNVHQITKDLVYGTIPFLKNLIFNEKEEYDKFMNDMDILSKNGINVDLKTIPLIKKYYETRISKMNLHENLFQTKYKRLYNEHLNDVKRNVNLKNDTYDSDLETEISKAYEEEMNKNKKLQKEFIYTCEHLIVDVLDNSSETESNVKIFDNVKRTERFIFMKYGLIDHIVKNINLKIVLGIIKNYKVKEQQLKQHTVIFSEKMILSCVQKKLDHMDKNTYKFDKGYSMTFLYPSMRFSYLRSRVKLSKNIIIKNIFDKNITKKLYDHFTNVSPIGIMIRNYFNGVGTTTNEQNIHLGTETLLSSPLPQKRNFDIEKLSRGKFLKFESKQIPDLNHKNDAPNLKRFTEKSLSLNISVAYPCIPSILGYCTNCALLDSTFSMFYKAGSRLLSNYSITSNTSITSKNIDFFNTNLNCITFVSTVTNNSCGCLNYYYSFYTNVNWSSPNQTYNPLAFPSGIRILPGTNGRGTFFDLFGGNPIESMRAYFSGFNIFGYTSFEIKFSLLANFGRPNSIKEIKSAIENSYPESNQYSSGYLFLHDPFASQSSQVLNSNNNVINSLKTKNNQKRNTQKNSEQTISDGYPKTVSNFWDSFNYASKIYFDENPSLSSQIFFDTFVPKSELAIQNSLSICEIFVLNTIGKLSSKNLARICDIFGWPEIQYTTTNSDSFTQQIMTMKTFYSSNVIESAIEQNRSSTYPSYPFKNILLLSDNNPKLILDYFGVYEYVTNDVLNNYPAESEKPIRQTLNTKIFLNIDDPNENQSQKRQTLVQKTTLAKYIEYIYMEYKKTLIINTVSNNVDLNLDQPISSQSLAPPAGTRIFSYIESGAFDLTYFIFKIVDVNAILKLWDYIAQQVLWLTSELKDTFNDFSQKSSSIIGYKDFSYFDYYDVVGNQYSTQSSNYNRLGNFLTSKKSNGYSFVYYSSETIPNSLNILVGINSDDYSNPNLKIELTNYFDFVNQSETSYDRIINILTTTDNQALNNPLLQSIISNIGQNYNVFSPSTIPIVTSSVISTIYQTYVQPNYDYTCEVYRRTTLLSGIITVGFVYLLIALGILILTSKSGLSSLILIPLAMILSSLYLITVLIYVYNYPILNLFPFMLLPPCLATDLYQMWSCDILPKCFSFFYALAQNHDYTFDNCGTCPSQISFDSCKYDYGFFDGVDTFLILIKWFFPDIFKLLISSTDTVVINGTLIGNTNQLDYSILGIITRSFPFSLFFGGDYFSKKIIYLSNINMADKDQFDSIVFCLFFVGSILGTQSLSVGLLFISLVVSAMIAIAVFLGQILGLLLLFYSMLVAVQTTMLYNTVYATYPPNMMAIDQILEKERRRRYGKQMSSNSASNTVSNSRRVTQIKSNGKGILLSEYETLNYLKSSETNPFKKISKNRKPSICDRTDMIGWLYNNIWWYRVNKNYDYVHNVHNNMWENIKKDKENMYYKKSWIIGEGPFMKKVKRLNKNKRKYD